MAKYLRKDSITQWADPDHYVDTIRGRIKYRDWCRLEAARQTACGRPAMVSTDTRLRHIAVTRRGA